MYNISSKLPALAAALGQFSGLAPYRKFGMNPAVGASYEDVTPYGDQTFPTSASTLSVVSDSTDDASGGTGAVTVKLIGLDANYNELEETVTMNGTTAVPTTASFLRCDRAKVVTAGTGEVNAGTITISHTAATVAQIEAGHGQTLQVAFTVPARKRFVIMSWGMSTPKGDDVEGEIQVSGFNEAWQTKGELFVYQGHDNEDLNGTVVAAARSRVRVRAKSSIPGAECSASIHGFLVDD